MAGTFLSALNRCCFLLSATYSIPHLSEVMGSTLQSPFLLWQHKCPIQEDNASSPGWENHVVNDQGFTRPAPAALAAAFHEMFTHHRPSHPSQYAFSLWASSPVSQIGSWGLGVNREEQGPRPEPPQPASSGSNLFISPHVQDLWGKWRSPREIPSKSS